MSIRGECFDNGDSGRCNVWDCYKFLDGDCETPGEIYEQCFDELHPDMEKEIHDIYPELPELNLKKESGVMSKKLEALDTQRETKILAVRT